MPSAVIALMLSFAVAMAVTPLIRRGAIRLGAVDEPGWRRVHLCVTPRLGGIAVVLAFFTPLATFAIVPTRAMAGFLEQSDLVLGLVLGSVVVASVGAIDDIRGLGPWPKLAAQCLAGTIAYLAGYRIAAINIPLVGDLEMGAAALPVTVFWFLAITNAINLIDGLDGLAVGITLIATITNIAIAHVNGAAIAVLLSASLGGALLGFLRYNFNPATIFLGDSGSMFIGFTLAATSLAGGVIKSSTAVALLAPIIALGLPILDTLLAMIRRTMARRSIFAADRGHIHHRLLDLGFTHRRVVLVLYFVSIVLALSAVAIAFGRSWNVGVALVLLGGALFILVRTGVRMPMNPAAAAQAAIKTAGFRKQLALAVSEIQGAVNEVELKDALSRLSDSDPSLVDLRIVDDLHSPSPASEMGKRFEIRVGDSIRYLELRFCGLMPKEVRDELISYASAVVRACGDALSRFSSRGAQDLRALSSTPRRALGTRS